MKTVSKNACFGGVQGVYTHASSATGTDMQFSVYVPPGDGPFPVLYFLSGLTCTDQNFTTKAGAQRYAAEHGLVIVAPDTSPRGDDVADDEGWDFGKGAGFYVDATQKPWAAHYQMDTYVTQELPALIAEAFPIDAARAGLTGHSMGGHGALVLGLRNPEQYQSISAFAPIASPLECPWGHKALGGYLGDDRAKWRAYDACALLQDRGWKGDLLVDQGLADGFLEEQLKPELLEAAAVAAEVPLTLRRHAGYDHSYYFVSTFIGDHVAWHAAQLKTPR